jgi:small subunit ribosomal protein S9
MEIINTSGRRKTSIARVYFSKGKGNITINGRDYKKYFPSPILQYKVTQAFTISKVDVKGYDVKVNVDGGGINGQAEAIRLGIAKAFVDLWK